MLVTLRVQRVPEIQVLFTTLVCWLQDSVTAIPLDVWDLDFIAPSILCTTQGNVCIPTSYPIPKGAVTIEVPDASVPDQPQPPNKQDPKAKLQYLGEGVSIMTFLP